MSPERSDATILTNPRPAARLIVKQGPQIGIIFPVVGDRVRLGREEANDIKIQDAEVSRRHCELVWKDNALIVQDIGSSNGTFVNGTQVTTPTTLKAGDRIGLGQTILVLEFDPVGEGAQAAYELPPSSRPIAPSAPHAAQQTVPQKRNKLLWIGCGFLLLLVVCCVVSLLAADLLDFIDLGIPGFSQLNLVF